MVGMIPVSIVLFGVVIRISRKDTSTVKKDSLKLPPVTSFYREQKNRGYDFH